MSASMRADSVVSRSALLDSSVLIDAMFGVTIAALFSGINTDIGPAKVQLSDVLAAATIFLVGLRSFSAPRASPVVALILVSYLLVFIVSALFVGAANGIKEIIQLLLVFSFVFAAFGYYRTRSTDRLLVIASILILSILAYNIGWHVAQGDYVGWKQLNEPKTIFTILPFLLILLFDRFGGNRRRYWFLVAFSVAAIIILLSGERKAYIFGIAAIAIWTAPFKWQHAVAAVLILPLLLVAPKLDPTGYLDRQVASFADGVSGSGASDVSLSYLIDEHRPTTMSNAQRELSHRLAIALWKEKPVLGIGTNAFTPAIEQEVGIPKKFRIGIHGEFYRALYENGILGFGLYSALWLAAFAGIALGWSTTRNSSDPNLNRLKLICTTMLLVYCALEGSKGLTLACICALPFIVALRPRVSAPIARRRDVVWPQQGSATWTR